MNIRLKRYKKTFEHSYAFGVFPTIELLSQPQADVLGVIAHPRGAENAGLTRIQEICEQRAIPFEFQEKSFSRLGARDNDYAVGIFQKNEPGLDASRDHVILVNPGGRGNLGTIIRTMLGFGFRDLAVVEPAADIFHPDVIRASMGAHFRLHFARFLDFDSYQKAFPRRYYPLMTDGHTTLPELKPAPPFGVIFGSESAGLPAEYHKIGTSIRIPQSNEIDSLNLAVSLGITLYQLTADQASQA